MSTKLEQNTNQLILISFPKCLISLFIIILLIFLTAGVLTENEMKIVDYFIVLFVCLTGMVIQKYKITKFDKLNGQVTLITKSVLGHKEEKYPLSEIKNIDIVYGRGGQSAKGGAVYLRISEQEHIIVDSDICIGNLKKTIKVKDEIKTWLSL
jgi:hypothetical protein